MSASQSAQSPKKSCMPTAEPQPTHRPTQVPAPYNKVALVSKMKALGQSRKERQGSFRSGSQPAPEKAALPCQPAAAWCRKWSPRQRPTPRHVRQPTRMRSFIDIDIISQIHNVQCHGGEHAVRCIDQ